MLSPNWSIAKDVVTLLIALTGAVLGIINSVSTANQKKVKLKAVAKFALPFDSADGWGPTMGCIEVTNLGHVPVYLAEIGFEMIGNSSRYSVTQPITTDHQPFARKLDSRQSLTGYFDWPITGSYVAGRCYVRTESGETFHGNSLRS